ncbi:MAG: hypothetical protein RSB29_06240 [Alistipes sp.]
MRVDIVRQPLAVAFATLLVFVLVALAHVGGASAGSIGTPSLLGGFVLHEQIAFPLWSRLLSAGLLLGSGLLLGRMSLRYSLYAVHTYLALPLYGLFACSLLVSDDYLLSSLISLILVLAIRSYNAAFCNGYGFGSIFRASLCLGILPLIYTPLLSLVVLLPMVVILFERSLRETLVAVVGYLLPIFALSYVNWGLGGAFSTPMVDLCHSFMTHNGFSIAATTPALRGTLALLSLLYLGAVVCYFMGFYTLSSKSRSILSFQLFLFLVIGTMLFTPCASAVSLPLLAIPASVSLPLLFIRLKSTIAMWLYVVVVVFCGVALFF